MQHGRVHVTYQGKRGPSFPSVRGVRAGDVLASDLFNLGLAYMLREIEKDGARQRDGIGNTQYWIENAY